MCGFFGIYSLEQEQNFVFSKEIKTEIEKRLHHRGPDSQNWHITRDYILGCVRLSITGRNEDSNMPFITKTKR